MTGVGPWIRLLRPFTLLPPLLGMLSGAASAVGAVRPDMGLWRGFASVALGAAMAAILNGASNVLNQVHDLEIDRINKPERPLPRGEVTLGAARLYAIILYAAALGLAFLVQPAGTPELFWIVVATALLTWAYSGAGLRLRKSWWLAPLVIAVPRGGLLKVAGWATLAPVFSDREPWMLGGVFFLFVLGAASTKDFSDMEGDRKGGVVTLPIRFGPRGAARIMAPFYVLPWLALVAGAWCTPGGRPLLSIDPLAATVLGAGLSVHGFLAARRMVLVAESLSDSSRGRSAWRHLYLVMMEAQVGVALVYLLQLRR